MTAEVARNKLKSLASPEAAALATRFFKTGPGQYGEGDTFIGINVPTLRTVSRSFRALPLDEVRALLNSPVHEERHLALMIIARLGPDEGEAALREPHVRAFDITGKPMRTWVAVEPEGVEDDDQLKAWIERAVKFGRTLPKK